MRKIIIPSLVVCSLFAVEENFIEIGTGFNQVKDNFSTNSNSRRSNHSSGKTKNDTMPSFSFYYGDSISDNTIIYVSSEFGSLVFGSEIETDIGLFDIGLKGELMNEAWENPFLLNSKRTKTDVQEFGGYIGYGIPLSPKYFVSLTYEYSSVDFDKDTVVSDLKRDGNRHILSLEDFYEYSENILFMGKVSYEKYSATGKASSYDLQGLEVVMINQLTYNVELTLMGGIAKKEFDKLNTVLNKQIDSTVTTVHSSLKFSEPFDYKDTYVSLSFGYENEDANHNFYDKENKFSILSMGYTF
jgi:hypothetical protein